VGPGGGAPGVGSGGRSPSEAESFVAFDAPTEEPNLTLMTDSFFAVSGVWGEGLNSPLGGLSPQALFCPRPGLSFQ